MSGGSLIPRLRLSGLLFLLALGISDDHGCAALQYQPVEVFPGGEECALVLDGPGRTSVYDYTYNLLRGSFPPSAGSQTCITYDAVNHAYLEARKRVNVARPKTEEWRPEDLATVGELLLDISVNLAQTYGLTTEEIEKSLPLIDTSKTLIREVCPAYLSNVECRPGKYRRYDGLCTNLENPTWGATQTPFTRLLSPRFADGITAPRISVTGNELPLSRVVSRTMHPDEGFHDHAGTVMVIAWGQFMDHDYTLTGTPLDPLNRNDPEECCSRPPHLKNPYCNEIIIPEDDYFYRLFNVRCMDFVRAFPAVRPGCRLGSRVPFNLLTGVLDGNTVYGITEHFSRKLRSGYGGLLRMNPVFSEYGLKDLLPLKLDIPDEGCTRPNRSMYCFEAGEIRVNEQLVLTCMHTLMAREHNRAAKALAQVNPHWDDETLFQESRRIVIAEIQHVTYNEFLPILLGKDVMEKFGLLLEKDRYWDGYDSSVNPGVIDAFASAAFRFGHSLLPTAVERWSKAHKFIASKRLSDLIRRPYDLYRAGVIDEYFMGLMNQVAQAMDDSITQEVTNHLFKKVGAKFGMDLVSLNMQRGREFGIPSYMEFRKFCGLPGADTFEELFGSMPNETIRRYSSIFEHPSDVDLWSGGVSERPLPGSMLGPTFACVIATQFSYSRRGDRFWYELPNQPSSFTLEQLNEIRKARLARLICDNTDLIDTIQLYPMVLPDHEINPRVPCRSGVLPGIDFSKWAEFPTTGHAARYDESTGQSGPQEVQAETVSTLVYARVLQRKQSPKQMTLSSILRRNGVRLNKKNKPSRKSYQNSRQNALSAWLSMGSSRPTDIFEHKSKWNRKLNREPARNRDRFEKRARDITRRQKSPGNFIWNDVMKITTVVETIRRRAKRNADPTNSTRSDEESTSTKKRSKRATAEHQQKDTVLKITKTPSAQGNQLESNGFQLGRRNTTSLLDKIYGHPRLTTEEKKEINRNISLLQEETANSAVIVKPINAEGILATARVPRRLETMFRPQIRIPSPSYTAIFRDCNATAASSEIADLNIPPPKPKYIKRKQPVIPDIDFPRNAETDKDVDEKAPRQEELPSSPKASNDDEEKEEESQKSTTSAPTRAEIRNRTYINLRDHQSGVPVAAPPKDNNGYPADIPPYNPDKIPYVDVPDYADRREESLDHDDRRVSTGKIKDYDEADTDAVDPNASPRDEEISEKNTAERTNDDHEDTKSNDDGDDEDEEEDEESPAGQLDRISFPEISKLREEYAIDDDDDEEEEEEEEKRPRLRESEEEKEEEEEEEKEERPQPKSENEVTPREAADDEKKSEEVKADDEERKEEEKEEEESRDKKVHQSPDDAKEDQNKTIDFEPVDFDLSEYTKPFSFEEVFGEDFDEPAIGKKGGKKGTEDINEHSGSKNVPFHDTKLIDKFSTDVPKASEEGDKAAADHESDKSFPYFYDKPTFREVRNENEGEDRKGQGKEKEEGESRDEEVLKQPGDDRKDIDAFKLADFDIDEYKKPFNFEEYFGDESNKQSTEKRDDEERLEDIKEDSNSEEEEEEEEEVPIHEQIQKYAPYHSKGFFHGYPFTDDDDEEEPKKEEKPKRKKEPHYEVHEDPEKDEEDVNEYDGSQNIPRQSEIDYYKKYGPSNEEEKTQEKNKPSSTPFDRLFSNETAEESTPDSQTESETVSDEEFRLGDKNFFKPLHEDEKQEASEVSVNEKDFISRYFSDDVKRMLKKKELQEEAKKASESKSAPVVSEEETYQALASILAKKDDISRFDENLNKNVKNGTKMPEYNNFWVLEYSSPRRNETLGSKIKNV